MLELECKLKDGRKVYLDSFFERKTYAGLLMGRPNASINLDILNSVGEIAARVWPEEPSAVLGVDAYRASIHEPLPRVICAGEFISYEPARDPSRAGSSLILIWLQEEMFPLLKGKNFAWLNDISWNQVARDFDW